jgi:hypothetical protein
VQLTTSSSKDCQKQSINDMNNALSRVSTWAHENELTLNPSKSVALFIANGRFGCY